LVRWGQIRPATRKALRGWLVEHCPTGDAEFALEGCTGGRYVVEELAAAGAVAHLGDPAEIADKRGSKKRAKTDRADARLLRTLLLSVAGRETLSRAELSRRAVNKGRSWGGRGADQAVVAA
jgi:transposase